MPDDISVGRQLRALRLKRGLRQADVARRARLSDSTISRLEAGRFDGVSVRALREVSRAMSMPPIVTLGWRGPEVERLLDEAHSAMVEAVAAELATLAWRVLPEHSFSRFGERGAVDILAWQEAQRTLLVIEVKTRIWDLQATLATLDRKRRLSWDLAGPLGWPALHAGVLLVLPDQRSSRALVARRDATFQAALPARGPSVRAWLRQPAGDLRGVWFLHNSHAVEVMQRWRPKRRRMRHARVQQVGSDGSKKCDAAP